MNKGVQLSVQILLWMLLSIYPEVLLLDHTGVLFLFSGGTTTLFSKAVTLFFTFPPTAYQGSNFSQLSWTLVIFSFVFVFWRVAILMTVRWHLFILNWHQTHCARWAGRGWSVKKDVNKLLDVVLASVLESVQGNKNIIWTLAFIKQLPCVQAQG